MKSPRRLPTLSLREEFEDEGDEDEANPFYLGSTGKTPRPTDSVEQALSEKMRDFVLKTGGGFASVDLRKIHQGPALVPHGIITVGKRSHVIQKGPPKLLANILHRLNRKRSLITRYFADQTVNRWKVSLLYLLFRGWANVTTSRPKSIGGMLQFINRARGRGVRFWFNKWHQTHNRRCRDNLRLRELKLLNEHRLRLLEIETNSMEAQQVNGLVASDLIEQTEVVAKQQQDLQHLEQRSQKLADELERVKKRLAKLDSLLASPSMFVPERTSAALSEWDTSSRQTDYKTLSKITVILNGLTRRPWQDASLSIGLESAAKAYRAAEAEAKRRREAKDELKKKDAMKFDIKKNEHHVNPKHPRAHAAWHKFWEQEIVDLDIHHVFHRLKKALKSSRMVYGHKVTSSKTLFNALDMDDDGFLTRMELWQGMQRLDLGLTSLQIRTVLHAVDVDNSGTIEFPEFKKAFKKTKKQWRKWKQQKRIAILKLTEKSDNKVTTTDSKGSETNEQEQETAGEKETHEKRKKKRRHHAQTIESALAGECPAVEDMEEDAEHSSPASRGDRDATLRLRWFKSLADKDDLLLPQDLRGGKLWARVLDKLARVSVFEAMFKAKQYERGAGQQRNRNQRITSVVKNLRRLGVFVPRTARTPAGFLEASDEVHLSMANEVMCRFPGIFAPTNPLRAAEQELERLRNQWSTLNQLHHVLNSRLAIVHSFGNISDVDEIYIHGLDEAQKKFFIEAHKYHNEITKCYDQMKLLERGRKGGERRMLQCELSSSLENSNRLLQHLEDVKELHKKSTEAEGPSQALSAEEDRKDLMRYAQVPDAWLGTADDREEIEACLLSNSIEARKIFRYYSYNGVYMSLDNFFELAVDAGVLAEIESDALVVVFRATVHPVHPPPMERHVVEVELGEEEGDAVTKSQHVRKDATSEQFIEVCIRLARAMRPKMNVADGLQDIWDEYMSRSRPPREQWNSVREFIRRKDIVLAIKRRRDMLWKKFCMFATLSPNKVECVSREQFYTMCSEWGHIVRGIPPGGINLMFAHAAGARDFDEVRQRKCPMVFPQFIIAVVALFLRGGVDPFMQASHALLVYFDEHLAIPKPAEELQRDGTDTPRPVLAEEE